MSHKIMIVDDEPANLRLLERLFRRDYQVLLASSGEEALKMLAVHDVALLVTDQRMPGMTGIELLKRTAEFRPQMVRVILTGYTDVGALVEAINCGQVYKYVTKPWDNDALRLVVERALEHYEATKSLHELELTNRRLRARLGRLTSTVFTALTEANELEGAAQSDFTELVRLTEIEDAPPAPARAPTEDRVPVEFILA
ncbi:MAG: response regulator [Pyrinomonadaceae bacterium]